MLQSNKKPVLSSYYLAKLNRKRTWFVSAAVRNLSHVCLERALSKEEDIFEFFVAPGLEDSFEKLMSLLAKKGDVITFEKTKNRFS